MSDARLENVQHSLQDYLLRGDRGIEAHVLGTTRVPVETRLRIYGDAYRARLLEALGSNYPVLAKMLGPDEFATLGHRYIDSHDSRFFSIRWYGDELPQFLATSPDYARAGLLADLAKWEWTMTEVFDAADASYLTADDLSRVPPDEWPMLRFAWHPSVRVLALQWNAPQVWKAVSADESRPAAEFRFEGTAWLLWRRELETRFRSLEPREAALIDASRAGSAFYELTERLCEFVPETEAPMQLAIQLRSWVEAGLITAAK